MITLIVVLLAKGLVVEGFQIVDCKSLLQLYVLVMAEYSKPFSAYFHFAAAFQAYSSALYVVLYVCSR